MRIALLSDLHANMAAVQACHDHAQSQGVDQWVILGDLIGYGPDPIEVVHWSQQMHNTGAVVLRGNHDQRWPAEQVIEGSGYQRDRQWLAQWTNSQLNEEQWKWLESLPLTYQVGSAYMVHATANQPESWHYASDPQRAERSLKGAIQAHPNTQYVLSGHVHQQQLFFEGSGAHKTLMPFQPKPGIKIPVGAHRKWVATVGSVGQARDGDTRAGYAILDLKANTLTFHRVAYDFAQTAQRLRQKGLPEGLAQRLESGQ